MTCYHTLFSLSLPRESKKLSQYVFFFAIFRHGPGPIRLREGWRRGGWRWEGLLGGPSGRAKQCMS